MNINTLAWSHCVAGVDMHTVSRLVRRADVVIHTAAEGLCTAGRRG
jgi:hypothetical protein